MITVSERLFRMERIFFHTLKQAGVDYIRNGADNHIPGNINISVMKCPVVKWQKGQSYRPILVQYADTTKSIVSKAYGRSPEEQIPAGSHSVIRGLVTNRLMVTPGALQSKAADSKYRCYRHVTDS